MNRKKNVTKKNPQISKLLNIDEPRIPGADPQMISLWIPHIDAL